MRSRSVILLRSSSVLRSGCWFSVRLHISFRVEGISGNKNASIIRIEALAFTIS